jgi:hypothetical protein
MKKQLLLITAAAFCLVLQSFGQCTPNTAITGTGYYPDSAQGLPPAYVSVAYNTVVQIKCPTDTVIQPYGSIHINYIQLDSVKIDSSGSKHFKKFMPNFTYSTSPANGQFVNPPSPSKNGANGCILITGTAVSGQETAGPTGNGKYPVIVYFRTNATVPIVGTINQPGTKTGYFMTVLPASAQGIIEEQSGEFDVYQNVPNPADSHTDISYWTPNTTNVEFRVYDVLGNMVSSRSIHSEAGANKFSFETSTLASGIYLYSLRNGNKTVSKRMIVSSH